MDNESLDIEALRKAVEDEAKRVKANEGKHDKENAPRTEKVLGGMLELSPTLASAVNVAVNWLQPTVRRMVENGIRSAATPALAKTGMRPDTALKTAGYMADTAGWALTFYDEAAGAVNHTHKHYKEVADLKQRLSKANVAHGGKVNSLDALKGNELVGVELRRLSMRFHTNMMGEACKLLSSAPQAWIKVLDDKNKGQGGSLQRIKGEKFDAWIERIKVQGPKYTEEMRLREKTLQDLMKPIVEDLETSGMKGYELSKNKENIRAELRKELMAQEGSQVDEKTIRELMVPVGAIGSVAARDMLLKGRSDQEKGTNATAFDMIEKLTDTVINDKNATSVGGLKFDAYIRKIFDTHQENMNEPHIGKRFDEKVDFACKEIAKAITEGRMHPMALVSLVGDRKIVKDKGKHIATRDEVTQAIDEQIRIFPAKFAVDPEEYKAELVVTQEDLKNAVDQLQGNDRAFAVALMPDEVALDLGFREDEIKAAREASKATMAQDLTNAVLDLATLSDDKLKEAKFSEAEIALVRKVAPQAQQGNFDKVLEEVGRKGEFKDKLDTTVINALGAQLVRHPGALFDQAGQKVFGEHESPSGSYADEEKTEKKSGTTSFAEHEHPGGSYLDGDGKKEKDKKKPLEKASAPHGFGREGEEDEHPGHRKPASPLRPNKGHAHNDWGALGESREEASGFADKTEKHRPEHVVHHAQHDGTHREHNRHLN